MTHTTKVFVNLQYIVVTFCEPDKNTHLLGMLKLITYIPFVLTNKPKITFHVAYRISVKHNC